MSGIAKDTTRLRVSDGVAVANVPQVVAERAPGDPSIQCDNVVGFPTGEFYGTTYRVITDDHGVRAVDKSSILDFVGTATNNVITIVSVAPGYVDSGSQRGDYVSIKPTASALNELADRLDETSTERALANVSNENLALRGRGVISGLGIVGASTGWSLAIGGKYATDGMFDEALLARNDGSKRRTSSRSTTPTAFAYSKPSMSSGQSVVSAIVQTAQPTGANSAVSYMQVNGAAATTGSAVAPTMEQVASAVGDTLCWAVIGYATCAASATSSASITTAVEWSKIPANAISSLLASKVIMPSASNGGADLGTVYSRTIPSGYGSSISLKRVGNIVFANGVNSLTGAPSGINNLSETIPRGYRPSSTSSLVGFGFSGSTPSNQTWLLNAPSGTSPSSITALISSSGNQNFFVNGSYITKDAPIAGDAI